MQQAIEGANRLNSPFDLAHANFLAAILHLFLREFANGKAAANVGTTVSDQHGFRQAESGCKLFLGFAEVCLGHAADGMQVIESGLRGLVESGSRLLWTVLLGWIAAAQGLVGTVSEAMKTVNESLRVNPQELSFRPESMTIH